MISIISFSSIYPSDLAEVEKRTSANLVYNSIHIHPRAVRSWGLLSYSYIQQYKMRTNRSLCKAVIYGYWLFLNYGCSAVQEGIMSISFSNEKSLKKCLHCVMHDLGGARLTPIDFKFNPNDEYTLEEPCELEKNRIVFRTIGPQAFFANVVPFCQRKSKCLTISLQNIVDNVPSGTDEMTLAKQPEWMVCFIGNVQSVNWLCTSCIQEASDTDILHSCKNSCKGEYAELKSKHCRYLVDQLTQNKPKLPEDNEGVNYPRNFRGVKVTITKELLEKPHCLMVKDKKSGSNMCQRSLAKHFGGFIAGILVPPTDPNEKNVRDLDKLPKLIERYCNKVSEAKKDDPGCKMHFDDIFVASTAMYQVSAPLPTDTATIGLQVSEAKKDDPGCKMHFDDIFVASTAMYQVSAPLPTDTATIGLQGRTNAAIAGDCIWSLSDTYTTSLCVECLLEKTRLMTYAEVMKLSDQTHLIKPPKKTSRMAVASCVGDELCSQVKFVSAAFCQYEMNLRKSISPIPGAYMGHQNEVMLDAVISERIHSPNLMELDNDMNVDAKLEEAIVVGWSSSDTAKCLECLAILKEVILVSIERSYAWVLDDTSNFFTRSWRCQNCQLTQKIKPLYIDVHALHSFSSIELTKLYSGGMSGDTSTILPTLNPEKKEEVGTSHGKSRNRKRRSQ
ncbi:hypothetical protein ABG067_004024 [Albugo candida]